MAVVHLLAFLQTTRGMLGSLPNSAPSILHMPLQQAVCFYYIRTCCTPGVLAHNAMLYSVSFLGSHAVT